MAEAARHLPSTGRDPETVFLSTLTSPYFVTVTAILGTLSSRLERLFVE